MHSKHPEPYPPKTAAQALVAEMTGLLMNTPSGSNPTPVLRAEVPLMACSPLEWLSAQREVTQYYWSDRESTFEMAGIGEADVLIPGEKTDTEALFDHIRRQLSPQYPSLRYYGGFRFHRGPVKGERWRAFKEYRFVVPRVEVVRRADAYFLACNARAGGPDENARTLETVKTTLGNVQFPDTFTTLAVPAILAREDHPDREGWDRLVHGILDAIARGDLEKVVLARETCFTAEVPLDPVALLLRLSEYSPVSFRFCFHPADDRAFIGASPERLYHRNGCYLQSEAIAGTRPRGKTEEQDRMFGEELMKTPRLRREQQFVVDMLKSRFESLCYEVKVEPEPWLLRLSNCQHLCTRIEGLLKDTFADASLIETLHPTPATGGTPRDKALRFIESEEPFDRGIYASPTGWVGYDSAEFCVAIRSGLVLGNTLALYTGAGVLAGSTPQEEWDEIETKLANFLTVLNIDAG